jgi:hypothetical protein
MINIQRSKTTPDFKSPQTHSFRPAKPQFSCPAADAASKLRLFDFPLNSELSGVCRAVELPSGRQVCEYPVVDIKMAELFKQLQRA